MADNALGWVSVPFVPTFEGITQRIEKGLVKPAEAASKKASGAVQKTADDMVKSLERQAAASKKKVDDLGKAAESAAGKEEVARQKVQAAIAKQKAAEEDYQKAIAKGDSGVKELAKLEDAKAKVADANVKLKKSEQDTAAAQKKAAGQADDYARTMGKLEDAQKQAAKEAEKSEGVFGKLRSAMSRVSDEADGVEGKFRGGLGIGAVAGVVSSITSSAIGSFSEFVSGATEASDATDKFKSTLDFAGLDTSTIEQVTAQAQKYADQTVYDLGDIQNMTAQLAANGVDNYAGLAEAAGNLNAIAGGNADTFKSVGMVMSQTAGAGKLTTENWNQLSDAIPGASGKVQEALEQAGAYTGNFRDAMAEGQITAEEFNDAVMQLGTEPVAVEAAKSTQTFEGMLGNLQATIQGGLADAFTELKPYIETFVNSMSGLAEKYLPVMVQALETGIEKLKTFGEWVQKNRDWLEPLVVSLGAAVAVFEAWTAATKIAAGVQAAFNLVMAANPIMLAVMAIAALVAGLTYFFTKTETGRELWEKFTQALGDGWDWVVEKLSAGWEWLNENVFQPLGAFFTETLWPTIDSVLTWVSDKWQAMLDAVTAVWGWLRDNVLIPLASFFTDTLWPAVSSALGWVSDKWNWLYGILSSVVSWIWDNVIMRSINGYVNLWNRAQEAIGWLVDKWNWMRDRLNDGWVWIDSNVFTPLKDGLTSVKNWFGTMVDNIGRLWDGIKRKAAEPVNFVINSVFNNGILKAWNKVAGMVGLDQDNVRIPTIGGYATGGILPGYTPGRDVHRFYSPTAGLLDLSGGEGIARPEVVKAMGEAGFNSLNAAARTGGIGAVKKMLGQGAQFATGGILAFKKGGIFPNGDTEKKEEVSGRVRAAQDFVRSQHGKPYQWGGVGNPSWDCSGLWSGIVRVINGGDGFAGRLFNTTSFMANPGQFGFERGLNGPVTVGVSDDHMAGTLAGINAESASDPKGVQLGGSAWGSDNAYFPNQYTMTDIIGEFISGGNGGGGGGFNLGAAVKKAWDAVVGKIGNFPGAEQFGKFGQLPAAFAKKAIDAVWDFISKKIPFGGGAGSYDGAGGVSGNVESWREMAMAAMRRNGFNADDPAQVNAMLAQIQSESGGVADINQQIVDVNGTGASAGQGLLQIIPSTFEANRDPSLPNDRTDPWANMNAALRYYRATYGGDLTTTWGHGHGYADGGILPKLGLFDNGGWLEHGAMAINKSGSPEPVFNASQWKTLSDVIRSVGILVPAIKAQTDVLADVAEGAQEWLAKAADPKSIEGINARSGINAFLDLGLDLPGQDVIKAVVDGESAIWDARDRQLGHLDAIAEKEKALADARKELEDLMKDEGGLSKDEQRKLDDAKKALEEAKAKQAKADSDEKRAAAADKVADAEEKLKRVREDQADNAAENAQKRKEEITKANEAVKKSETELAQARQAQAKDLDNLVLLSQDSIMGMVPVAEGLAGQLTALGAPAAMVSQGLGAVTSALGGAASMVGPAGLSLGVAVEMLKQAIGIIKKIMGFIKEIIERVRKAQLEALKTLADGLGTIAEYAKLVAEMQQNVASLQQELVRGLMEQRTAMFNLRVAVADKASAEMESAISVAKARQDLDKELEAQAKARAIRMTGLFEDWDSYLTFQADVAAGMLDKWSDTAISKLYAYEAARATALKGELESRLNVIKAEDAARKAAMQNVRNQQDLLIAQERLIKMSAKVAGVDLEDATGMEQIAKVMSELAEAQQALDKNIFGRWGYKLGANGQFANEYRGQLAQRESLRNVLDTLMAETGVQIDEASLKRTLRLMGETAFRGGDTMAVLRSQLPQLAAAEEKLRTNEALKPIWDVRDDATDMRRTVEDFTNEVELYGKTQPLEEAVAGLEKAIMSLDQTSEAFAQGNEGLRGDYLRAADRNASSARDLGVVWKLDSSVATPGVRGQVAKEVHIALDGEAMYTADQVDKLLAEVTAGTNVRVTTRRASTVATARRNGGI
ncbi:tape measure protein [Corynebacterium phoceense]|uniref:tape measure protein n=1 Tax=Corynebacterium phoceense TaxID=1686286 RepID=UPI0034CEEA34